MTLLPPLLKTTAVCRKKIAFIIPTLDQCGAEKQMTLLAVHLPKDEFEVHVIALTRGGPYAEQLKTANIPLTAIGKHFEAMRNKRHRNWSGCFWSRRS
ncbi:MAG: hypothetical protein FWE67_03185 [Planctomycetaceae bacterium]|nr:hypothetical protein [Planctomycetaceae bacterium]